MLAIVPILEIYIFKFENAIQIFNPPSIIYLYK